MRVVLTGAFGFLGWHTRVRLRSLTEHDVTPVGRETWHDLEALVRGADAVIHVAGVNRGDPSEVEEGNIALAHDVAAAVRSAGTVSRLVYANSTLADTATPYGVGKSTASAVLSNAADDSGATFVDVRLPNLFGEHGRPHYNSFVATFVDAVVTGRGVELADRPIALMHAQTAAQALIDGLTTTQSRIDPVGHATTVAAVYDQLKCNAELYRTGEIPRLEGSFDIDLFNTLRARIHDARSPIPLELHSDDRGALVETVRSQGGGGQSFVSSTHPGITRGEHFHLTKVERFVVVSGTARISMRRVFTDEVVSFEVSGEKPMAVDMPTMWVHNITNIGETELLTQFWTNTLFDPDHPDTYWEPVMPAAKAVHA